MSGSAQAFANFSATIPQSISINRFQSLPRWPNAPTTFRFNSDYLTPNALTSLIPIIVGIALTILTLVHLIIRYTCRSTSTDERTRKVASHPVLSNLQIIVSAIVITAITVFFSLGLLGNAALRFSVDDALDVIHGVVADLSRLGFAFLDTALLMENRIATFSVDNTTLPPALQTSIGDHITPTFRALRTYALGLFPDIEPLRVQLDILVREIDDVLRVVSKITDIVYGVTLGIIVILASAPILLFLSDTLSRKQRRGRKVLHLVFLIPILLSWLLVGVVQSSGIVVSDVCVALHDYRIVLMGGTAPPNGFTESDFTCPTPEVASEIQARISDTAEGVTQSPLARDTIELMLDEPSERVADAANWSGGQAARLVNCSTQVEFSGKLEFIVCGAHGSSAINGLSDLFVAFLGLALSLHIALFVGLVGVEVARCLFVWRMTAKESDDDLVSSDDDRLVDGLQDDDNDGKRV